MAETRRLISCNEVCECRLFWAFLITAENVFCSHGSVSGKHVSCVSYEMARTCSVGVQISQMDRRSFITHQVVFVQPVRFHQELFLLRTVRSPGRWAEA
jgi:hypothetical protein